MSLLQNQPLLRGSSPMPLSRPPSSNASDSRLSASRLLPPGGEASHDTHTRVPSSSNLASIGGYPSFQQTDDHIQGANHASVAQDSHPAIFSPHSRLMFSGAHATFQESTHIHQVQNMRSGIQILYEHSAPGAAYNSKDRYDPPKCHPNTRTGLLNTTRDRPNNGRSRIIWLHGSAGAGKSAIAQTMAMEFQAGCNLAASFFFSRTAPLDSHRGHEGRFVTSIAYQLTEVVPGLQRYVEQVVLNKPSVFDLTLSEQVTALIIDPLKQLQLEMGTPPSMLPKVIVVDGLDECKEESGQTQVLEAIVTLVSYQGVFPCSVFLASRPELVIRSWITRKQWEHSELIQSISLLDHCDSDHDIKVFVNNEAAKISQSHPLKYILPDDWPSYEFVKEIVRRASGQFIYASTIMKYIKDLRGNPSDRLTAILRNSIPNYDRPYVELDALYLHILRQTQHPNLVHQILAFCVSTMTFYGSIGNTDSRTYLQMLLSLPLSVPTLLIDLQSIMNYDIDGMKFMADVHEQKLYPSLFHHASLLEFLLDPHRSKEFYVNVPWFDKRLSEISLEHIYYELHKDIPHEGYVAYCFLILLQTRAVLDSQQMDQIHEALSRWDSLHKTALYNSLEELPPMAFPKNERHVVANIDRNLWRKFLDILQSIPHNHYNRAYEKLDTFYLYTLRQTKDPIAAHRLLAFCVFLASIRVHERTTHEDFVDFCKSFLALPSVDILLSDLSSIIHHDIVLGQDNPCRRIAHPDKEHLDIDFDQDDLCRRIAHLGEGHPDIPVSNIFHHESFVVFLLNHQRAKEFYIDVEEFDRTFYELAMEGISVPRYLRLAPGDPYKKRLKVIHCFAILLQSETAATEWETGEVAEALQKWDSLDENMLYDVMELVLGGKSGSNTVKNRLRTLLGSTPAVRHIFATALERKRVQYHESLASSNLPLELFAFFRGVDESMLEFPLSITPEKIDLTLLMVVNIHHSCKQLPQCDMWGFLRHHPLKSSSWFTIAKILADCRVKHEGESEQLEDEDLDWGSVVREVSAAVLYYIKQIIALFDPSADIIRPTEVLDALQYLEGAIGQHWREIAALELLRYIQSSLWSECHISGEIVSALKELSDCLFPPNVVSTVENTALSSSLPGYSSSSAFLGSPCALPLWYLGGFDEQGDFEANMENNLGSIHDYVRLYYIYNNPASDSMDTMDSRLDRGTKKTDGIEANVLMLETRDLNADGNIDYASWSFDSRIERYKKSLRMEE